MSRLYPRATLFEWLCGIVVILCLAYPMMSYAEQSSQPETCKGAQAWYDQLDPAPLIKQYGIVVSDHAEFLAKSKAMVAIGDIEEDFASSKVPDCLATAKKWYDYGLQNLYSAAGTLLYAKNIDDYIVYGEALAESQKWFGQFRGYLSAIGVEVKDSPSLVFK